MSQHSSLISGFDFFSIYHQALWDLVLLRLNRLLKAQAGAAVFPLNCFSWLVAGKFLATPSSEVYVMN